MIVRFPWPLLILCTLAMIPLSGCGGGALCSPHGYVLARYEADVLAALPSDDPLYEAFDRDIMADPVIAHLLSLFDGTSGGFAATNLISPSPQTLSNHLVVVVGAHRNRLLTDINVQSGGRTVEIEHAVAVAIEGDANLAAVRGDFRELLALFLLAVTGHDPPAGLDDASSNCTCVTEQQAFWNGYALFQRDRDALGIETGPVSVLDANEWDCCQTWSRFRGSSDDCFCAQGVAGFLAELTVTTPTSYPQRYMLWFANYEPGETRDAKLLLASARMSRDDDAGLASFVTSYADTFPGEADLVRDIAKTWRMRMANADR